MKVIVNKEVMKVYSDVTQMNIMIGGLQWKQLQLFEYLSVRFNSDVLYDEELDICMYVFIDWWASLLM